ncbi:hypothetical protein [Rhodopirellula sp. MGV]|uniref:hypothetical protein n=1 Tax=Rhodopirellula sp. MGV TaxID=2023130 RepID=UPI001179F223|nr:hypothetical protein [Rhodopirellula sp. MGV]
MELTFEQRANQHRVAWIVGALEVADLIAWADSEIETIRRPAIELIDLSMCCDLSAQQINELLAKLAQQTDDIESTCLGLSQLASVVRRNKVSTETAIVSCHRLLQNEKLLAHDYFAEFISLEDDASRLRDRVAGPINAAELRESLLETLDHLPELAQAFNAG